MRTATIKVCLFDELSDQAKERVKQRFMEDCGYCHQSEAFDSLNKLAEHFGGRLSDYSIDFFDNSPSSAEFAMPDDMELDDLKKRVDALGEFNPETLKGHGSCVLTGYCADEDAIDGFRIAYHNGERELNALMQAAFKTWIKACHDDCRDEYTNETFGEFCDANNYEFTEAGKVYREKVAK